MKEQSKKKNFTFKLLYLSVWFARGLKPRSLVLVYILEEEGTMIL